MDLVPRAGRGLSDKNLRVMLMMILPQENKSKIADNRQLTTTDTILEYLDTQFTLQRSGHIVAQTKRHHSVNMVLPESTPQKLTAAGYSNDQINALIAALGKGAALPPRGPQRPARGKGDGRGK